MKTLRITILVFIFQGFLSYVQAQSFENDWQWLKLAEKSAGTTSLTYEKALLGIVANNLNDSLMVSYYDSIGSRLYDIIPQIRKQHGITSIEYWNLIDASSFILTKSADNSIKLTKRKGLVQFLKSLEKDYNLAGENEYVFVVGLSDVYNYLDNEEKAFYWGQKRFDFAKKSNNIEELVGAYSVLALLYTKFKKDDLFTTFLYNLITDTSITTKDKREIMDCVLNTNYFILSKNTKIDVANCILKATDNSFFNLQTLCHLASKHQDYFIFDIIENSGWFQGLNVEAKFDYYKWNSTGFSIYNNPQQSVDYLLKAIYHAQNNNRDDLNWHYHGSDATRKTHNWQWVAYYYECELSDKVSALKYLEKNLYATKDFYGELSETYYRELKTLANKYDLWHNNIDKVIQYDSVATSIAKQIYGINSEEYANSIISYIFCLRRKEQFSKGLSLCKEFISEADSANTFLHGIYNQAAICSKSLGLNYEAFLLFFRAIENCEDNRSKLSYAANLSSLLLETNDTRATIALIEKYHTETNNPIDNYSHLNTKAYILSNIDHKKAYDTFCEAEKYENTKEVKLLVNQQIFHYMSKANVAPDIHLRFSALQQALKLFDNNNTADSIMYAHVIADLADYYNAVNNIEKAGQLYDYAVKVYTRNIKEVSVNFLDFSDRAIMWALSHDYDPQLVKVAEQFLKIRKKLQGEMNTTYVIRRYQLLDTFSRFGFNEKADSLANEIISAQIPAEYENERYYFLGLYEQQSRKDLKKAADYYEKYLISSDASIGGIRIYGNLMDIYKELQEFDKFDKAESQYISMWYKDIESKWYHISEAERHNYLQLLTGWQISLAQSICTQRSIEIAANASLFCKGRLTQTTKAINYELARLGKSDNLSSVNIQQNINDNSDSSLFIANHIVTKQDSVHRETVYNEISTRSLENIVNSNIATVKKHLQNGDVGIDFVHVNASSLYAYIITKDKPVKLIQLELTPSFDNLTEDSYKLLHTQIRHAKRVFFSPSETLSVSPVETFLRDIFPDIEIHRVLSLSQIGSISNLEIKSAVAIGNPRFNDELTDKSSKTRGNIWQPLPGTKIEIDSICNLLSRKKIRISAYTDYDATESKIKEIDKTNTNLLHIATHGFFNTANHESGLLFTGANRGLEMKDIPDDKEDGILTCAEIEKLNFSKLTLVVLSACDTGLGTTNIDGVWGLQRAFRIAGAKNMIVSLKKVDDELTQSFMIDFYRNLANGNTINHSFWIAMDNADDDTRKSFILIE